MMPIAEESAASTRRSNRNLGSSRRGRPLTRAESVARLKKQLAIAKARNAAAANSRDDHSGSDDEHAFEDANWFFPREAHNVDGRRGHTSVDEAVDAVENKHRRKRRQSLAESQAQHAAIMASAAYTGARSAMRHMKVDPTSIADRPVWGRRAAPHKTN